MWSRIPEKQLRASCSGGIVMEFIDLKCQYRRIEANIKNRLGAVLEHGRFIMGPEVRELENKLAKYVGTKHAVSCASGTDALLLPLLAWGIAPGDAVFVPSFTFFATAEVVALLGAVPVFVDVENESFNIDPQKLQLAIDAVIRRDASLYPLPRPAREQKLHPKAVIPVDLFGIPAEYEQILKIAHRHGLLVLEDGAQSFGGSKNGARVCGFGCNAATTSFFPAKPLGCYGDGGAVFTDDDGLNEALLSLRIHGKGNNKYDNVRLGLNARLDTLQAAVLLAKLEIFQEELDARRQVAAWYSNALQRTPCRPPVLPAGCESAWAQYSVVTPEGMREGLVRHLKAAGIPTNLYYPSPLHLLPAFQSLGYRQGDMPVAEYLCRNILSLPMHPYLRKDQVKTVFESIYGFFESLPSI